MGRYIEKASVEQFSIIDFLARLGYHHRHRSGAEYFFNSMLREDDHSPSLSVNDAKGTWMDRGNAEPSRRGGGIIQLGQALWPYMNFVDVLNEITNVMEGRIYQPVAGYVPHRRDAPGAEANEYRYELVRTAAIGSYQPITDYLDNRGLLLSHSGLSEVYYRDRKRRDIHLPFFGVGWQNEHGNLEFSTTHGFKSSIGRKGITVIPSNNDHVQVFEGYFDYLSRLRFYPEPEGNPTVIVLNAVNMLIHALDRLPGFSKIDVYMDRDGPGLACTDALLRALPYATDRSYEYEDYKDYNEKLQAALAEDYRHSAQYPSKGIGR